MGSTKIKNSNVGEDGKINNNFTVQKGATALNVSLGEGAEANMGSVSVSNSTVNGEVNNTLAINEGAMALNVAIGEGSKADFGSTEIE